VLLAKLIQKWLSFSKSFGHSHSHIRHTVATL
jgi:hypothetical protein